MPANLTSFQSAVQLVSGANFAIFALPRLGQDELSAEEQRWLSAILLLERLSHPSWLVAKQGFSEFQLDRVDMDSKNSQVRRFALFVSILSAIYLIWMSAYPDDKIGYFTVIVLILGAVSPLNLAANHSVMRSQILASRGKRAVLFPSEATRTDV